MFGVDLFADYSQKRYPFPSHKGDAVEFIYEHGREFDAIHASPPCQHASAGTRALRSDGKVYPHLIEATRDALKATGRPYVMENVAGSAIGEPFVLCWSMFDLPPVVNEDGVPLRMERHRLFESNVLIMSPGECRHDKSVQVAGCYGGAQRTIEGAKKRRGGYVPSIPVQRQLMGVEWMTERGMHQALPPVYTEWIGAFLADAVGLGVAA